MLGLENLKVFSEKFFDGVKSVSKGLISAGDAQNETI